MKTLAMIVFMLFTCIHFLNAQVVSGPTEINDIEGYQPIAITENTQGNFSSPQELIISNSLADSTYTWKWDTLANDWALDPVLKTRTFYNAGNLPFQSISFKWNNFSWEPVFQLLRTFDANNNTIRIEYQAWNGASWEDSVRYSYTYDSNDNLTSLIDESWDGTAWILEDELLNTYDNSNNKIERTYNVYSGGIVSSGSQDQYIYDTNNNLLTHIDREWAGAGFINK